MHQTEFEEMVKAMRPKLFARANGVVGNAMVAEDLVQDCLLKMWYIRERLDEYESPEALAMTIVYRLSVNSLREKRENGELTEAESVGCDASPEEELIKEERRRGVRRIIEQLPDSQQALITMRHIHGMSIGEIAQAIGSAEGAVRTALSRSRKRIAQMFLEKQNDD